MRLFARFSIAMMLAEAKRNDRLPNAVASLVMDSALHGETDPAASASMALSMNSRTTAAGRSMTSPAAILRATRSSRIAGKPSRVSTAPGPARRATVSKATSL